MKMINYLQCEYPLPVLSEGEELPLDWSEVEFQTDSLLRLGGPLDKYTISEDGQIYKEAAKEVEPKEGEEEGYCAIEGFIAEYEGLERIDGYTGEIRFFGMHMSESDDYWFEFVALYKNGELLDLIQTEWNKESNTKRIEAQKKFVKELSKLNNSRTGLWYSFRSIYTFFVNLTIGWIIKFFLLVKRLIT